MRHDACSSWILWRVGSLFVALSPLQEGMARHKITTASAVEAGSSLDERRAINRSSERQIPFLQKREADCSQLPVWAVAVAVVLGLAR